MCVCVCVWLGKKNCWWNNIVGVIWIAINFVKDIFINYEFMTVRRGWSQEGVGEAMLSLVSRKIFKWLLHNYLAMTPYIHYSKCVLQSSKSGSEFESVCSSSTKLHVAYSHVIRFRFCKNFFLLVTLLSGLPVCTLATLCTVDSTRMLFFRSIYTL